MPAGKADSRPGGIFAILYKNITRIVIDHAEVGENCLFRSGHGWSLQFFATFGAEIRDGGPGIEMVAAVGASNKNDVPHNSADESDKADDKG